MLQRLFLPALAPVLLLAAGLGTAAAQSCATIGSSTFCGARGSHNTVGNTMVFSTGPAGQRIGNYAVIGAPGRTSLYRGAESRGLVGPRTFTGVATSRRFEPYDAAIARLRAEILAIEAQYRQQQLEQMQQSPAPGPDEAQRPPARIRAVNLAREARARAAAEAAPGSPGTE